MLVERSPLVRTGFRLILEDETDIAVVAEVSHADQGVAALGVGGVDVVIISSTIDRDASRTSAIASLRRAADVKIVCVGNWADVRDVDNALAAGASACVELLDATDADLKTAVCLAGRGDRYLSPGLSPTTSFGESGWETACERLTTREKEVLVLIAQSRSTREIAHELNLSANTIAVHRNHIMKKIGVRKATALALFAAERGLLARAKITHTKITK
jgi:DNA-binding NarL/FixJ family response regulator